MFLEAFNIFNSIKRNWKHVGKFNCLFGEVECTKQLPHTCLLEFFTFSQIKIHWKYLKFSTHLLNITVHSISFISFLDQLDWQFTHLLTVRWWRLSLCFRRRGGEATDHTSGCIRAVYWSAKKNCLHQAQFIKLNLENFSRKMSIYQTYNLHHSWLVGGLVCNICPEESKVCSLVLWMLIFVESRILITSR